MCLHDLHLHTTPCMALAVNCPRIPTAQDEGAGRTLGGLLNKGGQGYIPNCGWVLYPLFRCL